MDTGLMQPSSDFMVLRSFNTLKITEDPQRALFMWAIFITIHHNEHKAEKYKKYL